MAGWIVMGLVAFAPAVDARTCGETSIDAGTVTPGIGETATTFTFSVTVTDDTGAKPAWVVVRVIGQLKPMTTTDTDARAGLSYRLSTTLPAGSWSYGFRVRNARGLECDLKTVDPATITITAPTPTPAPTSNAALTPEPSANDGSSSPPKPDGSPDPGTSLSPTASATPAPTPEPVAGLVGSVPPGGEEPGVDAGASGLAYVGPILIWLLTSAGGVALFFLLVRRSADAGPDRLVLVAASVGAGTTARVPPSAPPIDLTPARPKGRSTMLPPIPPRTFDRPPEAGLERAKIGYRRVRISSKPDSVRSVERGRLERGDEVEILDSYEGYLEIRTPDGITGWILRHTIVG